MPRQLCLLLASVFLAGCQCGQGRTNLAYPAPLVTIARIGPETRPSTGTPQLVAVCRMTNVGGAYLWYSGVAREVPFVQIAYLRDGRWKIEEVTASGPAPGAVNRFEIAPGDSTEFTEAVPSHGVRTLRIAVRFTDSTEDTGGTVVWSAPVDVPEGRE